MKNSDAFLEYELRVDQLEMLISEITFSHKKEIENVLNSFEEIKESQVEIWKLEIQKQLDSSREQVHLKAKDIQDLSQQLTMQFDNQRIQFEKNIKCALRVTENGKNGYRTYSRISF